MNNEKPKPDEYWWIETIDNKIIIARIGGVFYEDCVFLCGITDPIDFGMVKRWISKVDMPIDDDIYSNNDISLLSTLLYVFLAFCCGWIIGKVLNLIQ